MRFRFVGVHVVHRDRSLWRIRRPLIVIEDLVMSGLPIAARLEGVSAELSVRVDRSIEVTSEIEGLWHSLIMGLVSLS